MGVLKDMVSKRYFIHFLLTLFTFTRLAGADQPKAPPLLLPDTNGKYFFLEDYVGANAVEPKPVIISFFATWCEPCKDEMKAIMRLKQRFEDKLVVRFVNIEPYTKREKVLKFVERLGVQKFTLFDPYMEYAKRWGVVKERSGGTDTTLPACFLIGKSGRIVFKHFGTSNDMESRLRELIEAELKAGD